jgi:hypothetical protein
MATKPLHRWTVQESNNITVYEEYKYQGLTANATSIASGDESADWSSNPAKEFTLTKVSGDDANTISLQLKVKGSYGDTIELLVSEFPLTIDKILVQQIRIATNQSDTDEVFRLLSFH